MNSFSPVTRLSVLAILFLVFPVATALAGIPMESELPVRTVTSNSTEEIFSLFDSVGYTAEAWQQGLREIPRIYMTSIPKRWKTESDQLTVARKKEIFFRLLAPVVLRTNELIMMERKQLNKLTTRYPNLDPEEKESLLALARKYKVIKAEQTRLDAKQLQELQTRVDIIPPSLALAQGAEESGWGTSRFALLGNSLFGQWDFSGAGIKPEQQRSGLGNYGLAAFDTPLDAVAAYARNLNTHRAYARMRALRAKIRQEDRKLSGYELAGTLNKYSERGQAYIDGLHTIMRVNKLAAADEAWLWNKSVIRIQPAE
jgi:Bax protein